MRIIAGTLRSRRLKTVEGEGYRPAMGKVREALFSMLSARLGADFDGLRVLDLFAGSGSLAFEALSRGAALAHLVELSPAAVRCLGENIDALGLRERAFVVKEDVLKVVRRVRGTGRGMAPSYELVFLDPPYHHHLAQGSLDGLVECGWLSPGAYVVMEIEDRLAVDVPTALTVEADRRFGQTRVLLMRLDEHTENA